MLFVTLTRAIVLCCAVLRLRALFHVSVNIRMLIDFIMGLHTCAVQTLCSVDMTNSAATPMVAVSRKAHIFSFSLCEDDLNDFKLEQVVQSEFRPSNQFHNLLPRTADNNL